MDHHSNNPEWEERDIFILSKGHATLAHYTVLAHYGYFDKDELITYGAYNSRFGCHSDCMKVPGVEASTGSLGHGIGLAVGIALGIKIRKDQRCVYVLIGDGESNEGTVWESIMVAVDQNLDNLTILYDNNGSQKRCLVINNPAERFEAFGAAVYSVDGHNIDKITNQINNKEGSLGLLINDKQLYNNLQNASKELEQLLRDLKDNPGKYVQFSVFGGKDKD